MIEMTVCPKNWPPHHNVNMEPCDVIQGPCVCGAWHTLDEEWIKKNIEEFGLVTSTLDNHGRIACPWCKEELSELWDYNWNDSECIETQCDHCDKEITMCSETSVSYTCYPRGKEFESKRA